MFPLFCSPLVSISFFKTNTILRTLPKIGHAILECYAVSVRSAYKSYSMDMNCLRLWRLARMEFMSFTTLFITLFAFKGVAGYFLVNNRVKTSGIFRLRHVYCIVSCIFPKRPSFFPIKSRYSSVLRWLTCSMIALSFRSYWRSIRVLVFTTSIAGNSVTSKWEFTPHTRISNWAASLTSAVI